jgi:putative aldouronate transport system substrate-binding protein
MSKKKQAISRRSFLTLTGASLVSGLAAACAAAPTAAPAAPAQPASGGDTAAQPAAATQAPAPTEAPAAEGLTELIYVYTNFVGIPKDQAAVEEALNKITTERIGAKMSLVNLEFGAFNDKIQLMSAGGEKYDLAYTASWVNDYYKNVSNGVFVELDELLKSRAPTLWASMPESTWNGARVGGKLFAAINQQIFVFMGGAVAKKAILEKYKIDLNAANRWADLEGAMETVKTGENITPMAGGSEMLQLSLLGYTEPDSTTSFLVNRPEDTSAELLYLLETPEYKENWDLVKRWQDNGYLPANVTKFDEEVANMKEGKAAFKTEPAIKPKGAAEFTERYGGEVEIKSFAKPVIATSGIVATLTGVSRTGNAEKSVDWLELVNRDKDVYNLLCFGIEGTHWNWKDQANEVIEQVKGSGYDPTTDWMFGNQFNAYYRNESQIGAWDETKKLNDAATPAPTLGFVFNREPVKNEIAAITALLAEYTPLGAKGQDSSIFPKMMADIKAAGSDKVKEEQVKQIEAWKSAK